MATARDYDSYCAKLKEAREVLRIYEEKVETGVVAIEDLIVSKRLTRAPRDHQKANLTAVAAQQLYSGIRLPPGQTVEQVITQAEARVPNVRARACGASGGPLFLSNEIAYFTGTMTCS